MKHCWIILALTLVPQDAIHVIVQDDEDPTSTNRPTLDHLERIISVTVDPSSWEEHGGPCTFETVPEWGMMIVVQTDEQHRQIELLLTALRKVRRLQANDAADDADGQSDEVTPKSIPIFPHDDLEKRNALIAKLRETSSWDWDSVPLVDVIKDVSSHHDLPITIDVQSLEDTGVASNEPVTFRANDIQVGFLLDMVLREIDLTFIVRGGELRILSYRQARTVLETRIYSVDDLVIHRTSSPDHRTDEEADANENDQLPNTMDEMMNDLQSNPNFGSWGELRKVQAPLGSGSAFLRSGVIVPVAEWEFLVISQTDFHMSQIERSLTVGREERLENARIDDRPDNEIQDMLGIDTLAIESSSYPSDSEARQSLNSILSTVVAVDWKNVSLDELAQELEDDWEISMVIDLDALAYYGVDEHTRVSYASDEIELGTALTSMLRELELEWRHAGNVLHLTTSWEGTRFRTTIVPIRRLTRE